MSDHAHEEDDKGDELMDQVHEGSELVEWATEAAHGGGAHNEMIPGLGLLSGAVGFGTGLHHMVKDPSVDAALEMGNGAKTVVQDGALLVGSEVAHKMGPVAAALDGASAINELRKGDYAHATRDGAAAVMDATGPEGMALAASFKGGWWLGEHAESAASNYAEKHNYLGGHRNIHDHAMDVGDTVNDFVGHGTAGKLAGATAAAGAAVGDTLYTGGRYAGEKAADGAKWAAGKVGDAGSAVADFFTGDDEPSMGDLIQGQVMVNKAIAQYAHQPEVLKVSLIAMQAMGNGAAGGALEALREQHPKAPAQNDNARRPNENPLAPLPFLHFAE